MRIFRPYNYETFPLELVNVKYFLIFHRTMKQSIVLIAVTAAVMMVGASAVTTTTPAFASASAGGGAVGAGGPNGDNGVNGGSGGPGNSDFGHSHQGASGGLRVKPVEG